jgi:urease accessory protein
MKPNPRVIIASLVPLASPGLAHAHHAMGGRMPSNFFEGFVSGLAHPVIGLDHLFFVLAIGAACYAFRRGAGTVAAYLLAALAGTAAHLYRATIPYPDAWVAATLIVAGVLLLRASPFLKSGAAAGFFALAGFLHGYAYGESIVGAEPTPLAAYLAGFTLVQVAVVFAGYALARAIDAKRPALGAARAFGGAVAVVGAVFLALSFAV